jgi:hypothetical protein
VRYDGELGYALGAYIGRLQYAYWAGPEDNGPLLTRLLSAINSDQLLNVERKIKQSPIPSDTPAEADAVRVQPPTAADPRVLQQRPDQPALPDDPCYLERGADQLVLPLADYIGQTLVIKAPYKMGKTSLLIRYLDRCRKNQKRIAFVDFQLFSDAELNDSTLILTGLAAQLIREFDIGSDITQPVTSPISLTKFIEDVIFARIPEPVTLALDEVDRLVMHPYQNTLFAMLRGWHNRRASHSWRGWGRFDLALVVSTEPSLLIQDNQQSPFNVTDPFRLGPLSRSQLTRLNSVFGNLLHDGELDILHELTGGHPYLTRLAFYRLGPAVRMPFLELVRRAADDDGPFSEHLRAKLTQLEHRPELASAITRLIRRNIVPNENTYYRLHAAGVVKREDSQVLPANLLYAHFFRRVLQR